MNVCVACLSWSKCNVNWMMDRKGLLLLLQASRLFQARTSQYGRGKKNIHTNTKGQSSNKLVLVHLRTACTIRCHMIWECIQSTSAARLSCCIYQIPENDGRCAQPTPLSLSLSLSLFPSLLVSDSGGRAITRGTDPSELEDTPSATIAIPTP